MAGHNTKHCARLLGTGEWGSSGQLAELRRGSALQKHPWRPGVSLSWGSVFVRVV